MTRPRSLLSFAQRGETGIKRVGSNPTEKGRQHPNEPFDGVIVVDLDARRQTSSSMEVW